MKPGTDIFNGVPICFTRDERHALTNLIRHIHKVVEERYDGWQVEMIANVAQVNRLIYTCVHRGHKQPDPLQMNLPTG